MPVARSVEVLAQTAQRPISEQFTLLQAAAALAFPAVRVAALTAQVQPSPVALAPQE